MDTFEINSEENKASGINILYSDIGKKIKETSLKLKSKETFDIPLNLLSDYPFPYTAIDHVLNEVRKETSNGYSIHRKLSITTLIGYTIKRFR